MRQFSLLTGAEERALWVEIEGWKGRRQRALYTAPVALATLHRVLQQVAGGKMPRLKVLRDPGEAEGRPTRIATLLADATTTLTHLQTELQTLQARRQALPRAAGDRRRAWRRAYARLWRQWIATWVALDLHADVHAALQQALHAALQEDPRMRHCAPPVQRSSVPRPAIATPRSACGAPTYVWPFMWQSTTRDAACRCSI